MNIKQLTKNSPVVDFYDNAHYLLLSMNGKFTMQEIYEKMIAKCSNDVPFNFIQVVILEVLDDLLNKGMILYIDEGIYESSLTESKEL